MFPLVFTHLKLILKCNFNCWWLIALTCTRRHSKHHFLIQKLLYLLIIRAAQGDLSLTYQLLHSDGNSAAMMEKPPLRGSCFYALCGNSAQFKEAPSLWSPIVLNGSQPKAALLFPLFQPQLYQTLCDRIAWPVPGSPSRNPFSNILLCHKFLAFPVPLSQEVKAFLH